METKISFKIRKIGTYILPFISMFFVSKIIEFIVNNLFGSSNLLTDHMLNLFVCLIWPIVLLIVGYYIEPENKRKAIKILSIIYCVLNLIILLGGGLGYIVPTLGIISTVITFLIIDRLAINKIRTNERQS